MKKGRKTTEWRREEEGKTARKRISANISSSSSSFYNIASSTYILSVLLLVRNALRFVRIFFCCASWLSLSLSSVSFRLIWSIELESLFFSYTLYACMWRQALYMYANNIFPELPLILSVLVVFVEVSAHTAHPHPHSVLCVRVQGTRINMK